MSDKPKDKPPIESLRGASSYNMSDKSKDKPKTLRGLYYYYSTRTECKDADGEFIQSMQNMDISTKDDGIDTSEPVKKVSSDDTIESIEPVKSLQKASKDEPTRLSSFADLFRCADWKDMLYIRIAFLMSAISGCNQPVQLIIFGRYHILIHVLTYHNSGNCNEIDIAYDRPPFLY
jgi:hypothetical protein